MMNKVKAYGEIAKEMDKIMEPFKKEYSNEILGAYALSCADEPHLDKLVASYGFEVTDDGYDIDEADIHYIASSEVNKEMAIKAPVERQADKISSRINSEISKVEDALAEYSESRIPELYEEIVNKLDEVQSLYSVNKEALGISEDRYRDVIDSIENIKEQLEELSQAPELDPYTQDDKEKGLLQSLKKASPAFSHEQAQDEIERDDR